MAKKRGVLGGEDLRRLLKHSTKRPATRAKRPWRQFSRKGSSLRDHEDLEREFAEETAQSNASRRTTDDAVAKPLIGNESERLTFGSGHPLNDAYTLTDLDARAGGETQETPTDRFLNQPFSEASNEALIAELRARGLSAETSKLISEELADKGRPRWNDEDLPKELRGISAPAFFKIAWKDVLGRKMVISKMRVRRYDNDLLVSVEAYISKRVRRKAEDLGDAEGINFVVDEAKSNNTTRAYKKIKEARKASPI